MNIKRFTHPNGTTECFVNLDQIVAAKPAEDGRLILQGPEVDISVDAAQFEEAISKGDSHPETLIPVMNRLILALERLSVRIPTTIRMHM